MKNKGFTLIELMIVVAILGILAAILIPALMGTKKKEKEAFMADCTMVEAKYECEVKWAQMHPDNRVIIRRY